MPLNYLFRYILASLYLLLSLIQLHLFPHNRLLTLGIMVLSLALAIHLLDKNTQLASPLFVLAFLALLGMVYPAGFYLLLALYCLIFAILVASDTLATQLSQRFNP